MYRTFLVFAYVAVNLLLFFFNWNLFTTVVNMDLLFVKINILPFLVIQIFGLIIIFLFWIIEKNRDVKQDLKVVLLQKELMELKKNNEIAALKKETVVIKETES